MTQLVLWPWAGVAPMSFRAYPGDARNSWDPSSRSFGPTYMPLVPLLCILVSLQAIVTIGVPSAHSHVGAPAVMPGVCACRVIFCGSPCLQYRPPLSSAASLSGMALTLYCEISLAPFPTKEPLPARSQRSCSISFWLVLSRPYSEALPSFALARDSASVGF